MKKFIILALATVSLLAVAFDASAQSYSYQALTVPATLSGGTTNLATPPVIGPLKQQNLAISATISATAATTNIYTLNRSVDGVNWDTNGAVVVTLGAYVAGSTPVTTTTNFNTFGYGFYRIASVQVVGSGTVTNNSVSYGIKLVSP